MSNLFYTAFSINNTSEYEKESEEFIF